MKVTSLILLKFDDKMQFHQSACKLIGVNFPFEYFNNSFIRAFKDQNGNILGGYVLVTSMPSRVLESIPEESRKGIDEQKVFEITGMWLSPSLKVGKLSAMFWLQFAKDVSAQTDKDFYVYAYTLGNKKLKKLYSLANPKVLYEGKVKSLLGNNKDLYETVEIASRSRIKYLPIYGFLNIASKFLFNRKMYFQNLFHLRSNWIKK